VRCPHCLIGLSPDLDRGVTCTVCRSCRGTWISGKALERLLARCEGRNGDAPASDNDAISRLSEVVAGSDSRGELRCADCHTPMIKERFDPSIPVLVDRCPACDYIWLDAGERELLLALHYQFLTSDDPAIANKRERIERLQELQRVPLPGTRPFDVGTDSVNTLLADGPRLLKLLETRRISPDISSPLIDRSLSSFVDFLVGLRGHSF